MLCLGWRVVIFIGQLTRPYTCCANVYASLTGRRQLKRTRRTTDLVHTRACHRRPTTKPTAFVFPQTSSPPSIYLSIAVSLFFPRRVRLPRSDQPISIRPDQFPATPRKIPKTVSRCLTLLSCLRGSVRLVGRTVTLEKSEIFGNRLDFGSSELARICIGMFEFPPNCSKLPLMIVLFARSRLLIANEFFKLQRRQAFGKEMIAQLR